MACNGLSSASSNGVSASVIDRRNVGDRNTPLAVQLTQDGEAFDLTGYTVQFGMISEEGVVRVALTSTGVFITDAATGVVAYTWSAESVATAGTHYVFFVATNISTGKTETFPAGGRNFAVQLVTAMPGDA